MSESNDAWEEPQTVDEAQERRVALAVEVTQLQSQLGRADELPWFRQMTAAKRAEWRIDARRTVTNHQAELSRLNTWLKSQGVRPKTSPKQGSPSEERSPVDTLRRALRSMGKLYTLFVAVEAFLDEDTPETYDDLVVAFKSAKGAIPHEQVQDKIPA